MNIPEDHWSVIELFKDFFIKTMNRKVKNDGTCYAFVINRVIRLKIVIFNKIKVMATHFYFFL